MLLLLFVAFLIVPAIELYLIIEVSHQVGFGNTLIALVFISVIGAWMVKREGLEIIRKAQIELSKGNLPGKQIVEGLLILCAGVLMLTPGFGTDALGLVLLFPLTRIMLRSFLTRIFLKKLETGKTFFWATKNKGDQHIVDVEWDRSNQKNQNEKELEE
ncbi:MAG: membrane protein FxsA [Actinobacteria bacterium]|nr:membrane protein FxsA [Actinomycetota bacterium]|tara:strand:- start:4937 stop:5413 length:477 start_codon:yes stop_codon:yes gene_type:complete